MIVSDEIRRLRRFVAVRMADDTFRWLAPFFLGRQKAGDKVHHIRFVMVRFTAGTDCRFESTNPAFIANRVFSE